MAILRDIKKDIDSGDEPVGDTAPLDMLRKMQTQLQEHMPEAPTAEQIAEVTTQFIEQTGILDTETANMFKKLAESVMEKMSDEARGMANEFDKSGSDT